MKNEIISTNIKVKDNLIKVVRINDIDYISLTDLARYKNDNNPGDVIIKWMSNKGSFDFQLTEDKEGERLFEKVIRKSQEWGNDENMMYVVGATRGEMFTDIRKAAPNAFLLVPGVGAQGGSLQDVCKYGIIKDCGLLVNSSRGIIYADNTENFAKVAGQKAKELQAEMALELAKI